MNEVPGQAMPKDAEPTPPKSEFVRRLEALWEKNRFVCVGLDPDLNKIPASFNRNGAFTPGETIFLFNKDRIDRTAPFVCSFKPNSAFYEAQGTEGHWALQQTIEYVHANHPGIPVILDAKRADIGSTNEGYVTSAFDLLGADAITVNPYFGKEALEPFLRRSDKGVIVLARTSNPGAGELQNRKDETGEPLYLTVAKKVATEWNGNGNCALVVGATAPSELAEIRAVVGDIPILIPGIGAQGGEVNPTVKAGMDSRTWGMIINASRSIIFAEDPANAASQMNDQINLARNG